MTYDRSAIMKNAHKRYRDGRRLGLGWNFGRCLSTAWAAAKIRRAAESGRQGAVELTTPSGAHAVPPPGPARPRATSIELRPLAFP